MNDEFTRNELLRPEARNKLIKDGNINKISSPSSSTRVCQTHWQVVSTPALFLDIKKTSLWQMTWQISLHEFSYVPYLNAIPSSFSKSRLINEPTLNYDMQIDIRKKCHKNATRMERHLNNKVAALGRQTTRKLLQTLKAKCEKDKLMIL